MALTRAQIIAEALGQVGRSDLTSQGRLWLNNFLDYVYKNWDWVWLLKWNGETSLTDPLSFFSDYRKLKSANLMLNGQPQNQLFSVDAEEWMALRRQGISSGAPTHVFPDKEAGVFRFWPTPSGSFDWDPLYYKIPTLPTHLDGTGDSLTPTWGETEQLLIDGVKLGALYYNDDGRWESGVKDMMSGIVQAKLNSYDSRAGSNRIKMGKSFRRR
jgi:hypothetical protein